MILWSAEMNASSNFSSMAQKKFLKLSSRYFSDVQDYFFV